MPTGTEQHRWWKEAVVYQVYPSSFKDSNSDGWGDIKGITSKLDYMRELGVDILWCSPMYKSPQADMGYDISDYKDIDPKYGTLADVDELFIQLKKRGMKMMMDLVVNHTSEEHAWFLESRKSKDNTKRSWYIWKPAKGYDSAGDPIPPNNWCQILGDENSAWTWDARTREFYLSLFTPEQPDLNWENPAVRAAVHDVMKFWLDRGACGFRMDVINLISKVQSFPDAKEVLSPGHKYRPGFAFYANGPRLHEFLREMYDEVLSKYDAITVGEMPWVSDANEIVRVVGSKNKELNMIFIFDVVGLDDVPGESRLTMNKWTPKDLAHAVSRWQKIMIERDGWNSVFVENHDNPRSVSRYCDDSDEWRTKGAKLLALMQTTLAGTLYVYQGEEIGMRNTPPSWDVSEYKDVDSINYWKKSKHLYGDDKAKLDEAKYILDRKARDHARTPIQWSAAPQGGFSDVKPWMRVNDDYPEVNMEKQMDLAKSKQADGGMSVWHFWQRGLANRKEHKDVFVYGNFEVLADGSDGVFAYARGGDIGGWFIVVLNWGGAENNWAISDKYNVKKWVCGTYDPEHVEKPLKGKVQLRPWEGILGQCDG